MKDKVFLQKAFYFSDQNFSVFTLTIQDRFLIRKVVDGFVYVAEFFWNKCNDFNINLQGNEAFSILFSAKKK